VSNVVEKDLAHPYSVFRFTSRCQDTLIGHLAWQADVSQLLGMAQALQTPLRALHNLKD
jgi:hypothetical protein